MNTQDLQGKTILVTGGNSGIGLATAKLFAACGANVAILGRRKDTNARALEELRAISDRSIAFAGDATDRSCVRDAISRTVARFGNLTFAFNNAGVEQVTTPFVGIADEDYLRIMDVNVRGVFVCMQEELPHIQASGGCIVNCASVGGHIGQGLLAVYVASKHAVIGLTKSVALEYARQGVRINAVSPGAVTTELYERLTRGNQDIRNAFDQAHPMGRCGSPEEIAAGVLYLCRDATWTTGQTLHIDGGYTVP